MARKPKKRSFKGYRRGAVEELLDIGTLAADTLVSANFGASVDERTWISSLKAAWSLSGLTSSAGDGPLLVGIAHNDYSSAEIEAFIENTGSWQEGDLVAQEIGKRKIRIVGSFESLDVAASGWMVMNDGKPITTKCNWVLNTGDTLKVWAYNMGDSAFATTDPDLHVNGHANLWPA